MSSTDDFLGFVSLNFKRLRIAANGRTHAEEGQSRTGSDAAVFDFGLFGQVLGRSDGRFHQTSREESRQISRVRRDHNQREKPPENGGRSGRSRPASQDYSELN